MRSVVASTRGRGQPATMAFSSARRTSERGSRSSRRTISWARSMAETSNGSPQLSRRPATPRTIERFSKGHEPGLQSVATASGTPDSTSARPSAKGLPRTSDVPGSRVATTPAPASARRSSSSRCSKWSAEAARYSAANVAPPVCPNSLA